MTERKMYDVSAKRVNGWWILRVPAVGSVTQAKRLDQVEYMARDLIYAMTDEAPHSFDVAVKPDLGPSLGATLGKAVKARQDAASAQHEAMTESKRAAVELHRAGLTIRDVGELLGVSYQRVSQLVAADEWRRAIRFGVEIAYIHLQGAIIGRPDIDVRNELLASLKEGDLPPSRTKTEKNAPWCQS